MQMGGNQNERISDLAQRIDPVTEVSILILAFIYVTVFLMESCPVVRTVSDGMQI